MKKECNDDLIPTGNNLYIYIFFKKKAKLKFSPREFV